MSDDKIGFGGIERGVSSDKDPHSPAFGLIEEKSKTSNIPKPLKKPEASKQTSFDKHVDKIFTDEGGYNDYSKSKTSNDVPTNMGVRKETLIQYRDFKKQKNEKLPDSFTDDVKEVTSELTKKIYNEMYFKRYNINKVEDDFTAGHLLDISINPGPKRAGVWLQKSLDKHLGTNSRIKNSEGNLEYDGIIGPQTRDLINKAKEQGVLTKVNNDLADTRLKFYNDKADQIKEKSGFRPEWIGRANSYKRPE